MALISTFSAAVILVEAMGLGAALLTLAVRSSRAGASRHVPAWRCVATAKTV
jgi:hypothetical protein